MTTQSITGYYNGSISQYTPGTYTYNLHNAFISGGIAFGNNYSTESSTINVSGQGTFTLDTTVANYAGLDATVNLAANSLWLGTLSMVESGFLYIEGPSNSAFYNDGTSIINGGTVVINTNVMGSGTFDLTHYRSGSSNLAFANGSTVSSGQTVLMDNTANNVLNLGDPGTFHGTIDMAVTAGNPYASADINLMLEVAQSWSYRNDVLTFYNSQNKVCVRLDLEASVPFSVAKNAAGEVSVYTAYASHPAEEVAMRQIS